MMRPYFKTAVLQLPENGALAIPIELDFSTLTNGGADSFDLSQELMDAGGISFVQGAFIDNGLNLNSLVLTFLGPANQGFPLRIPPQTQSWQPILTPFDAARFTALSVAGNNIAGNPLKVGIHLVNFPVMPMMWNAPP